MKETAEYVIPENNKGLTLTMGGDDGDDIKYQGGTLEQYTDDNIEGDLDGSLDDNGEIDGDADTGSDDIASEGVDVELGDFDAEDPAVVEAFDLKYTLEDGSLDAEGILSQEYFANRDKGIDGLNEATYAYLATKGISKATVKQIEAMAATNVDATKNSVQADDLKLFTIAGGPDALQAALKWGKEGGYSEEQQQRFNKITQGKDFEAKQEAVEALIARYNRANPPKKPSLPRRDATKGQASQANQVKPYATRQEMREVRNTLRDNDKAGWELHNRRLLASRFE